MEPLRIVYRNPNNLKVNPHNANLHPPKQVHQIGGSIANFGNVNPILVDENLVIIAGHGRREAALELNLAEVPTIMVSHLSERQKRGLMLADNKIGKNSVWHDQNLRVELQMLSLDDEEFSVDVLGFDTPEIDRLLDIDLVDAADPLDDWTEPDRQGEAVARPGDVWELGSHRVYCGDSRDPASYAQLLEGELADQVITDPPYNVKIAEVVGLGRTKHREFAEASGEMTKSEFQSFLDRTLGQAQAHCRDGAILMAFMDWRHLQQLLQTGDHLSLELKNICVWSKANGGMGSLYRSQHELVAIFKNGTTPHTNNVELGRHGRYRTNVWQYAGANSFRRGRADDLATHPTVKPVALVADAIKDCSERNGLILDIFGGSGTTILAAERTGRRARLIEIDPHYVDATIRRWEKMTARKAQRVPTPVGEGA